MKVTKCKHFCNYHCSTSDCPNIQCDMFEDRYDLSSSEIGLERVNCKNCEYSDKNCDCDDCYFVGSKDCPEIQLSYHL